MNLVENQLKHLIVNFVIYFFATGFFPYWSTVIKINGDSCWVICVQTATWNWLACYDYNRITEVWRGGDGPWVNRDTGPWSLRRRRENEASTQRHHNGCEGVQINTHFSSFKIISVIWYVFCSLDSFDGRNKKSAIILAIFQHWVVCSRQHTSNTFYEFCWYLIHHYL